MKIVITLVLFTMLSNANAINCNLNDSTKRFAVNLEVLRLGASKSTMFSESKSKDANFYLTPRFLD